MKPILFNTEMVRAILDGRKTVTRRVAFPEKDLRPFPRVEYPDGWWFRGRAYRNWDDAMREPQGVMSFCKYRPGDILYVRETWAKIDGEYVFRADDEMPEGWHLTAWRPSIHMPREAARIFLRVTDVRVERLQGISPNQCVAEGADDGTAFREIGGEFVRGMFSDLWDSTIKPADLALYGWAANPWVRVIEYERISREEALNADR